MKKFFSILCAIAVAFSVSATPVKMIGNLQDAQKTEVKKALRAETIDVKAAALAPKAKADNTLTSGTFYTVGGLFAIYGSSGWQDGTSQMPSVEVTVDGDTVAIVGLAYWFKENALVGTIQNDTLTFPCQLIGTDSYGDEFLVGSNDGATVCDIVFVFDAAEQTLTAQTKFIMESAAIDAVQAYTYWSGAVFSAQEPEAPELVVLPEGATVVEYTMDYINPKDKSAAAKSINVAVVDDKVYFQGMSNYLSEAWVVGTIDGDTITFAANQYVGAYASLESYFFYNGETVFTYDSEADTYSATGEIFGVLGNQYYDGRYEDPVLSRAPEIDWDNKTEIVMAALEFTKYDSYYGDVIYSFSNATGDTLVQFDIYVENDLNDVIPGEVYTIDSMETSASYTFISAGGSKLGLKYVEFEKTIDAETGLAFIEATFVDGKNAVYHLIYQEKPFVPSGEEVNLFFDVPMAVPQYYTDGSWELYTETGDTIVALVYNSEDATSPAGNFTVADLQLEYSGIMLDGKTKLEIKIADIAVTEDSARIDATADLVANDSVTYHVKMFFIKPVVASQDTIASDNMTVDVSYFEWYGIVSFNAADEKNSIELTVNVDELGAGMAGDYTLGVDVNGTISPVGEGESEIEIYSGSINIAVSEDGEIALTGTVLAVNNVEYTLDLLFTPAIYDIEISAVSCVLNEGSIRYKLQDDDYTFYFKITLPEGEEDVESGKIYTFAEDMGGDTFSSYGFDSEYNFIDYESAEFVKTVTETQLEIRATVVDLKGNTWNLIYTENDEEGIENVVLTEKAQKVVVDGVVYVIRDHKMFNVLGTQVR